MILNFLPVFLTLTLCGFVPTCAKTSPDVFTAEISGMDCSLFLVTTKKKKVNKRKSSVECFTNETVHVPSVYVINDNTDNVFNLNLIARANKTKIIRGKLMSTPKDMEMLNMMSKSIQHQGPLDEKADLEKVVRSLGSNNSVSSSNITVHCTYQDPKDVSWSSCQKNGIRFKIIKLIGSTKQEGCFNYRTISEKCQGGSRSYSKVKDESSPSHKSYLHNKDTKNDSVHETEQPLNPIVSGYQICLPQEDNSTEADIAEDHTSSEHLSPGTIIEGDILVSPNQTNRNAVIGSQWPNNKLYYSFDSSVSSGQRSEINVAVQLLQSKLGQCIKFVQASTGNRVIISDGDGCSASVGYKGSRTMSLDSSGCRSTGTIQHEFIHSLGLRHEQARSDRDSFVDIFLSNVETGKEHNFDKYSTNEVTHYGKNYDFESVMHYKRTAFSKNGRDTILPIKKYSPFNDKIGQTDSASLGDVRRIQAHYGCPIVIQWKGRWGGFPSSPTFCPDGSFVYGYRLRSEAKQGWGDDTALNDIELYCRRPHSTTVEKKIWSDYRSWGSWSEDKYCSGTDNPVVGFDVKEEGAQGGGDDTAINDIDLYCKSGPYISASVNTDWGDWKPKQMCPPGFAVTGLRTQVEGKQGGGDDTALNGLELYCKKYP